MKSLFRTGTDPPRSRPSTWQVLEVGPTFVGLTAGKLIPKEEAKGIHWMTWTSVVGPEVNGIWPKYSNMSNVNSVDANYSSAVLVTGDDLGLVKLFRFPSLKKGWSLKSSLHFSRVTGFKWKVLEKFWKVQLGDSSMTQH